MRIQACPRCASLDLHPPTLADGGILGYSTTASIVCAACAFQGAPLEFSTRHDYEDFRSALAGGEEEVGDGDDLDANEKAFLADLDTGPSKAPSSRGTAVLVGLLGVGLMVATPFLVFGILGRWGSDAGTGAMAVVAILAAAVEFLEAWAILRIAKRLWRGPRSAP